MGLRIQSLVLPELWFALPDFIFRSWSALGFNAAVRAWSGSEVIFSWLFVAWV